MKIQEKEGFTLVEVITVVAILLILAAFAVPEARKAKPNFQLRSLAHDVLSTMQRARSLAVQKNSSVRVEFDNNGYKLIEEGSSDPIVSVSFLDYGDAELVTSGKCGAASKNWSGNDPHSSMSSVTFNSRGTAKANTGASGTVYFDNGLPDNTNQNNQCYAIGVQLTGGVKLRKYNNRSDQNQKKNWLE